MIRHLLFRIRDKFDDLRGLPMPALGRIWRDDREAWNYLLRRRLESGFTMRHVDRMCDWVWRQCPGLDAAQVASMVEASIHPGTKSWREMLKMLVGCAKEEASV